MAPRDVLEGGGRGGPGDAAAGAQAAEHRCQGRLHSMQCTYAMMLTWQSRKQCKQWAGEQGTVLLTLACCCDAATVVVGGVCGEGSTIFTDLALARTTRTANSPAASHTVRTIFLGWPPQILVSVELRELEEN